MRRIQFRNGISLLELMITITVTSAIMGLMIVLLGLLMRAETASRAHMGQIISIEQLAKRFRKDVRMATGHALSKPDQTKLTLRWEGTEVVYECRSEGVRRSELGQAAAEQLYPLSEQARPSFRAANLRGETLISFQYVQRKRGEIAITGAWMARLAKDRRFAKSEEGDR